MLQTKVKEETRLTQCIPRIRRIMRRAIIQTQSRWEAYTRLQSILFHQRPRAILNRVRDLRHRHPRFDMLASIVSYLTVDL